MDSDDIDLLNSRTDIAIFYMFNLFFGSFCYGISCVIYCLALANLWKRWQSSLAVKILYLLILGELLFDTVTNVSQLIQFTRDLLSWHVYSTTVPIGQQTGSQNASNIAYIVGVFFELPVIPIANAVVIWRAWILYSSNIWVRAGLVILWICEFAVGISQRAFLFAPVSDSINNKINGAHLFLSLGVNLVTTLAIAWQAWRHNLLLRVSEMMKQSSAVLHVLYTLIEWGVLLCIVQLVPAILAEISFEGDPASSQFIATAATETIVIALASIHPSLMVLILAKGRSVIENNTMIGPGVTRQGVAVGPVSTLRFAQSIGPIASSQDGTDKENPDAFIRSEKRDYQVGQDIPSSV